MSQKKQGAKNTTQKSEWWRSGVRFQCQGSGQCCVSRGEYGFVYLTLEERKRMAKLLKLPTATFTRRYCKKTDGVYHLKDGDGPECIFLTGNRCSVYEARPMQCRTWPFWPEVMSAKSWAKDVKAFCPGVGKGRLIKGDEIELALKKQTEWEEDLSHGL